MLVTKKQYDKIINSLVNKEFLEECKKSAKLFKDNAKKK